MTAGGLPCMHELRDELALLSTGEWVAWQRIGGSYDLLRRALVEAVRGTEGGDPGPLLDDCWSLLSSSRAKEQVVRFHRLEPHYAGVDVDAAWLHRNACALVATARTAHAAQMQDGPALASWAAAAGTLLGRPGTGGPSGSSNASTAPAAALVDQVFRDLMHHGWRIQGARVWTLAWLPRGAAPTGHPARGPGRACDPEPGVLDGPGVRVPVAGCFDSKGFLADLCLYSLPGEGELVPHPETALQPLGTQLLGGLRTVWEPSEQSVCFTFGVHDASVPSWVPLEGTSLSGAAALGFELLARGHKGEVPRVIIAQVGADGGLEPVGHEQEKMHAALEGGIRSVVLSEDSQVPETCIERYRQSGQEVLRARSLREVLDLPVATLPHVKRGRKAIAVIASLALVLAGLWVIDVLRDDCPGSSKLTLVAAAVWLDNEENAFQSVLDAFCERTGIRVDYNSSDVDMAGYLGLVGCTPPDVVMLAQPGLLRELANSGRLQRLGETAILNLDRNYTQASKDVGAVDGVQYGVYFKAANKSLWWYNTRELRSLGIQPPTDIEELLRAADTVTASGKPWLTIGGSDGWPLTDLFENIYLRTAGAANYDRLAAHQIRWDDPTVIDALQIMDDLLANRHLMGGAPGALATDWKASVLQVVSGTAATTFEGDFVLGYAYEHAKARARADLDFFDFPSVNGSPPAVVGGGDIGVALTDKKGAQDLLAFLATPEAASVWARRAGFTSPNRNVAEGAYRDAPTRRAARTLATTEVLRFDLSDQQPTSFGTKKDTGMWLRLQEFLRHRDPIATAQALEADYSKAAADLPGGGCPQVSSTTP